jgi:glycosyltransferase involved in cell wall biosynthesis
VTVWRLPLRHSRKAARYLLEYGASSCSSPTWLRFSTLAAATELVQVNSLPDALVFAAALPRLLGARVLLDLQECMPEFFATKFGGDLTHPAVRAIARVERASIRFAHLVIMPTSQMRDAFVARGADPAKITVVMDGADQDGFHPVRTTTGGRSLTLITHGTVEAHYGIDTVIEAVALLRDEIPELRLEIYGDGSDLPRLRQVAAERQVAGPFQRRVRTDRGTRRGESRGPTSEWWPCGATPSGTSPFPARCSTSSPWASRCCHPAPARLSRPSTRRASRGSNRATRPTSPR